MPKFVIGDRVRKISGYAFDGTVVAIKESEPIRYMVELDYNGMLHIFSEKQLDYNDVGDWANKEDLPGE